MTAEERNDMLHQELYEKTSLLNKFIYSCSHDLKGPLASIKGVINLAERSPQSCLGDEYLQHITESVRRMDHCLTSLESLMGNSWEPLLLTEISFLEIINGLAEDWKDVVMKQKIKLSIRVEQGTNIVSDALRIKLIVEHLLQNAIAFHKTSRPEKIIDISVKQSGQQVVLEVCDNGEGIPKERIAEIFKIFTRCSEASRGSGLGLYIVKEIVSKLNGAITVVSSKGVGSNFVVTLPITL